MAKTKKVIKRTRKVDVKGQAKETLSEMFVDFLEQQGIEVSTDHTDFAFTKGTIVVHMEKTDVQVKLITPKAGLERYQKIEYVDVEEDEITEEAYEKLELDMVESGEKEAEELPDEDDTGEEVPEEDDRQEA